MTKKSEEKLDGNRRSLALSIAVIVFGVALACLAAFGIAAIVYFIPDHPLASDIVKALSEIILTICGGVFGLLMSMTIAGAVAGGAGLRIVQSWFSGE
ncbi:MAG: hypothetical protein AAF902_01120 [Chloroflexota bacterium]